MPQAIWKGHISFGLVTIPVVLYSAEKSSDLHFTMLDRRNKSRIRYERVNAETGEPVPWDEIVKGYEYEEGSFVLVTDEDFKNAAVEATQSVDIEDFIDQKDIDPVYFDKPYYLVPGKKGEKGYVLLRETLRRAGKVGIAKVVIRTRQHLAALTTQGNVMVLELLRFPHELRSAEDLEVPGQDLSEYKISEKEIDMAEKLVESMAGSWEPQKYHDDYRDALLRWIERKAAAGDVDVVPDAGESRKQDEDGPAIINIMDLLKKSVESKAKAKKPGAAKDAPAPRKRKRA